MLDGPQRQAVSTPDSPPGTTAAGPPAGPASGAHGPGGRSPRRLRSWLAAHKKLTTLAAVALTIPAVVLGALIIVQPVTTTTTPKASSVVFEQGSGYSDLSTAGFATVTLTNGGATAALSVSGVPGAVSTTLGNVLNIKNTHASQAYDVVLSTPDTLPVAITSFIITVRDGSTTVANWDAVDNNPSLSSFALPASSTYTINVLITIASGTTLDVALPSFVLQVAATLA
ncbi:MAG TPA: hypothetical protein VFH47_06335 [Candidatus Thermoplasmatota archaeon]|nr:hypothetical protein [Candidatus Thermoplasmatota archaeon]